MQITWADALTRYVEARLMTGAELSALFSGIGIEPSERFEAGQIFPAIDVACIPIAAARLAAKADGSRPEFDWVWDALQLREAAIDHDLLRDGEPVPVELRKAAVGLGLLADLAAGMIRARMMEPLTPIEPPKMTADEVLALLHGAGESSPRPEPGLREQTNK